METQILGKLPLLFFFSFPCSLKPSLLPPFGNKLCILSPSTPPSKGPSLVFARAAGDFSRLQIRSFLPSFLFFFPPNPVAFRSAEMKAPIKISVPIKPRHFHVAAPCLSRQSLFVLGSRLHPRALKWPGGSVSPLSLSPLSRSPRR